MTVLGLPWWAWIYIATIPCILIALVVLGLCASAKHGDEQLEREALRPPRFPCEERIAARNGRPLASGIHRQRRAG